MATAILAGSIQMSDDFDEPLPEESSLDFC
jgi:hypothetical protein